MEKKESQLKAILSSIKRIIILLVVVLFIVMLVFILPKRYINAEIRMLADEGNSTPHGRYCFDKFVENGKYGCTFITLIQLKSCLKRGASSQEDK